MESKNSDNNRIPQVAVIIPVYNDSERLKLCLNALAEQIDSELGLNVLLVDNNSTEDIEGIAAEYQFVTYLHEAKPGSYHARNRALRELAEENYIGFTDADCIPSHNWIRQAVRALKENPNKAVGGPIHIFAENNKSASTAENYEILFAFKQKIAIEKENYSVTANLFVTKDMINNVGEFNSTLYSGGDMDYGQRLTQSGYPLRFIESMVIRHPARATLKQLTSRIRRFTGGSYMQRNAHGHLKSKYSWSGLLYNFRPPIKEFKIIVSDAKLNVIMKAKLCLLSLYLRLYQALIYVGYKLKILHKMERF